MRPNLDVFSSQIREKSFRPPIKKSQSLIPIRVSQYPNPKTLNWKEKKNVFSKTKNKNPIYNPKSQSPSSSL